MTADKPEDDITALSASLRDKLLANITPDAPPPEGGRDRLLSASLSVSRFEEFTTQLATEADIDEASANALLIALDDQTRWVDGIAPGMTLLHFEGGPRRARAITGFVRVEPGASFPTHSHMGEELVIVLQGEAEVGGVRLKRGDSRRAGPDDEHDVQSVSDIPLIYVAIVEEGIVLNGEKIPYDDPRA